MMTKTVKLAKINVKFNSLKRFSIGFVILLNYLRVQSKLYIYVEYLDSFFKSSVSRLLSIERMVSAYCVTLNVTAS